MNKLKSFLSAYGLYLVIGIMFFAGGILYGRYNIILISESEWENLIRSKQAIVQMTADAELQNNLKGMQ